MLVLSSSAVLTNQLCVVLEDEARISNVNSEVGRAWMHTAPQELPTLVLNSDDPNTPRK